MINDDEDNSAVQIQRSHMLTSQATRCRYLASQSIDDVMIGVVIWNPFIDLQLKF